MIDNIKVSVICMTFNQVDYVEKMLENIVSQKTDFQFEVIIHDDASTDGTTDIVRQFVDKYPNLFVPILQKENQYSKKVKMIPSLVAQVRGKYFAFCEGDDYWCDDHKLQKQYDAMEANLDCSICVHKTQNINEDGSLYPSVQGEYATITEGVLDIETICKLFLKKPTTIFHTSSYFIRMSMFRDAFLSNPEFSKYATGTDQVMLRICMTKGNFYYIDEIMTCYRRFAKGSINASHRNVNTDYWIQYYSKYAAGNTEFDKFSEYKFHSYIRGWIGINIMNLGRYDTKATKNLLKVYDIHLKDLRVAHNNKFYLKYVFITVLPRLSSLLYRCKKDSKLQ